MRGPLLLAAALLATGASAQTAGMPGAERPPDRPPERPGAEASAPPPAAGGEVRPPESRPAEAQPGTPPPSEPLEPPAVAEAAPPSGPPQRELLRETDADFSACLLALHVMGARYEAGPEITGEQRDCGIARPVTVTEALPGVVLEGAPPMRCEAARALAWWLRDHVIPAAARLPDAPRPVALVLGSTYQCRGVVGGATANLSEHAFGNAIDIAAIRFDAGEPLQIAAAGGSDMPAAFVAAIRGAACLFFTTVLGPGSNAAHEDHLHLDIKARRGGYRVCE